MLLAAIALFTQKPDILGDPALATPVTFSTRATNAVSGLQALSSATNVPMRADDSVAREIILLHLVQVPLNETMRRLADACGAGWTIDKGVYVLERTSESEQKRRQIDHSRLLTAMTRLVSKAKDDLAQEKPFDAERADSVAAELSQIYRAAATGVQRQDLYQKSYNLTKDLPFDRFALSVVSRLSPAVLAAAPPNRRTVFSTDPTEMEQPIQVDISSPLAVFQNEQTLWAGAVKAQPDGQGRSYFGSVNTFTDSPLKVNVVLNRTWYGGDSLTVELGDPEGEVWQMHSFAPPVSQPTWFKPAVGETAMKLVGDEAFELGRSRLGAYYLKKGAALPRSLAERLRRPDRFEPLASYPSTLLFQVAEMRHVNLVADVPDAFIDTGNNLQNLAFLTPTFYLNVALDLDPELARSDDGWLEIRGGALSPDNSLSWRADRGRLASLLGQAGMIGFMPQPLARYAFDSGFTYPDWLSRVWLNYEGVSVSADTWTALRLEGEIGPGIDDGASDAVKIRLGNCDSTVISMLTDSVFYDGRDFQFVPKERRPERNVMAYEPCDVFPHGLPLNSTITRSLTTTQTAFADGWGYGFDPQNIAMRTVAKNHPEWRPGWESGPTTADRFRMGVNWSLRFDLSLDPQSAAQLLAYGTRLDGGDAVDFESLPPDFVKSVKDAVATFDQYRIEEEKLRANGNGGGQTTNGPP